MLYQQIDINKFNELIAEYRKIQESFLINFQVDDIFSNSKIYEIVIANELNHNLIPGHSGSKDAKDDLGRIYEYKHFKETSSNHSWTFNDYSDSTILNLANAHEVIFAHVDDTDFPPVLDWYIPVNGKACSDYLKFRTDDLVLRAPKGKINDRRMINLSSTQLQKDLNAKKIEIKVSIANGKYSQLLNQIYQIGKGLEECTNVKNILTSNKLWEVLVAIDLKHNVNSEQGGRKGAHDAFDNEGNFYEYKVSKTFSWNFQDISENVLQKYLIDKSIILSVVDKTELKVRSIYSASPERVVARLREKLDQKKLSCEQKGTPLRRLQVSLTKGDLTTIGAVQIL